MIARSIHRGAVAGLVAAGLTFAHTAAQGYELKTTADGTPVRWHQGRVGFAIELDDAVVGLARGQAATAARGALATWSDAGGPLLVDEESGDPESAGAASSGGGAAGFVIRFATEPTDPEVDPGALALTDLSYDPATGAIASVSITINAVDYDWAIVDPAAGAATTCDGAFDLQSTLTHELGHALGLAHSADPTATMYPKSRPCDAARRTLAPDDLDGIAAAYAGADLGGESDPADASSGSDASLAGCSAGGASSPGAAAAFALLLLLAARGGLVTRRTAGRPAAARRPRRRAPPSCR